MSLFHPQPFRLKPIFRSYIWGGRRLESFLGKDLPDEREFAESWEIVDHGDDQSVVLNGDYAGETIRALIEKYPKEILGPATEIPSPTQIQNPQAGPTLPLLFKYLDCNRDLSVQVHPDDQYALQMPKPDLGKTEAWYIVHSEPQSKIYAGLKEGVDRKTLSEAIAAGQTEKTLHIIEPQIGDCVFIPAGTVHALGAGLVVAEIQQASDTTFRLFDWNRVDASGKGRPLHINQALEVIDYDSGPVSLAQPIDAHNETLVTNSTRPESLVACNKFKLERAVEPDAMKLPNDDRFRICTSVAGAFDLIVDDREMRVNLGDSVFIPAACREIELNSKTDHSTALIASVP